jgi:hypothetical protein
MANFQEAGMYFETKSTDTKKIFTIKFPYDVLLTIRWDEKELKKLQKLDSSDKISDQFQMLSMIAKKVEARTNDKESTRGTKK